LIDLDRLSFKSIIYTMTVNPSIIQIVGCDEVYHGENMDLELKCPLCGIVTNETDGMFTDDYITPGFYSFMCLNESCKYECIIDGKLFETLTRACKFPCDIPTLKIKSIIPSTLWDYDSDIPLNEAEIIQLHKKLRDLNDDVSDEFMKKHNFERFKRREEQNAEIRSFNLSLKIDSHDFGSPIKGWPKDITHHEYYLGILLEDGRKLTVWGD